jgi:hypothetical protein
MTKDGSLFVGKHVGKSPLKLMREMGSTNPVNGTILRHYFRLAGFKEFIKALKSFIPALLHQTSPKVWRIWGLINHSEDLVGIGTYKLSAIPYNPSSNESYFPLEQNGNFHQIQVEAFEYRTNLRQFYAECAVSKNLSKNIAWNILLINLDSYESIPLNYNNMRDLKETETGIRLKLSIPAQFLVNNRIKAILIADFTPLRTIILNSLK